MGFLSRRQMLLGSGGVLGTLAAAAAGPQVVLANGNRSANGVVGIWRATVRRAGSPLFTSIITFGVGGGCVEITSLAGSAGVGVWDQIDDEDRQFGFTFTKFRFEHGPVGSTVVASTNRLNESGDAFDHSATVKIFDADGKLIQTLSSAAHYTRYPG